MFGHGGTQNQRVMTVSTAIPLMALTKISAGFALYCAMSSLIGAVQGALVRRAAS